MHSAKIETERKMRKELDQRLITSRLEKLVNMMGKDLAVKVRHYAWLYNEEENNEVEQNMSSDLALVLKKGNSQVSTLISNVKRSVSFLSRVQTKESLLDRLA